MPIRRLRNLFGVLMARSREKEHMMDRRPRDTVTIKLLMTKRQKLPYELKPVTFTSQPSNQPPPSMPPARLSPDDQGPQGLLPHPILPNSCHPLHIHIALELDPHGADFRRLRRHRETLLRSPCPIDHRRGTSSWILDNPVAVETSCDGVEQRRVGRERLQAHRVEEVVLGPGELRGVLVRHEQPDACANRHWRPREDEITLADSDEDVDLLGMLAVVVVSSNGNTCRDLVVHDRGGGCWHPATGDVFDHAGRGVVGSNEDGDHTVDVVLFPVKPELMTDLLAVGGVAGVMLDMFEGCSIVRESFIDTQGTGEAVGVSGHLDEIRTCSATENDERSGITGAVSVSV